ncbi:MAG TPA: hypothetical protein VER14_06270, partial [Phototrophicaceae bacterium]|nr:hypothetical protein [Phototrophicaceae bacterium]
MQNINPIEYLVLALSLDYKAILICTITRKKMVLVLFSIQRYMLSTAAAAAATILHGDDDS